MDINDQLARLRQQLLESEQPEDLVDQSDIPQYDSVDCSTIEGKTFLPQDTREALAASEQLGQVLIDNFALKLNKAARFENNKFSFFKSDSKNKTVVYQPIADFGNLNFAHIAARNRAVVTTLCGANLRSFSATPEWRLIIGMGNESVYETSITLHHIYGIPYLRAESIKGSLRSFIITECFCSNEELAIQDQGFCEMFGCPKKVNQTQSYYNAEIKGVLEFFEAFPLSKPEIVPDIMNSHYGDYYSIDAQGTNVIPPADYLKLNPIFFLTVTGAPFEIHLAIEKEVEKPIPMASARMRVLARKLGVQNTAYRASPTYLLFAEACLKEVLATRGIGAKTSSGYGYANIISKDSR